LRIGSTTFQLPATFQLVWERHRLWLIAFAQFSERVPRRLDYVVSRRRDVQIDGDFIEQGITRTSTREKMGFAQ